MYIDPSDAIKPSVLVSVRRASEDVKHWHWLHGSFSGSWMTVCCASHTVPSLGPQLVCTFTQSFWKSHGNHFKFGLDVGPMQCAYFRQMLDWKSKYDYLLLICMHARHRILWQYFLSKNRKTKKKIPFFLWITGDVIIVYVWRWISRACTHIAQAAGILQNWWRQSCSGNYNHRRNAMTFMSSRLWSVVDCKG